MQCARGYYESGKRVHLFNMLKYALSISIAVVSYSQGRSLGNTRSIRFGLTKPLACRRRIAQEHFRLRLFA